MAVSRDPEFRTVRMREGYDLDAVDDFVDRVIDALDGRGGSRALSPDQIENEEFKVVRMREGYSMDDVDDWLDAAAAELRRIRKAAQAPQAHQGAGAVAHARASHGGPVQQAYAPPAPIVPPAAPPVAPPPMAPPPMAQPPAGAGYYDTAHGAPTQAFNPLADTTQGGPGQGLDPLTDTALNELDPALRALDPSFGRAGQAPAPPPAPPVHQPPQPVVHDSPQPDQSLGGVAATPNTGLHHLEIWVRDLELATRSFGWIFERLGWTLFQVWDNGRSWQSPGGGPYVVVERSPDLKWAPYDRTNPGMNHLALAVPERWMVDKIVTEAPAYGWRLMFADRHPFAGGDHHYAAYMENDEGFEVEVVAP